ncbi:MAG: hypothetical protein HY596_04670 [Candidatus Omnitrophica bacterium]|nr:hypothetical protein [Candidatus Omnitrophota bacterium]
MKNSLISRILIAGCSLVLALGLAELAFRLLWMKRFTIPAGIEDAHFHHRLKPSTTYHYYSAEFGVDVRTNRLGLRGPDPAAPKPPGLIRILMLGDSFTFGFPVKDEETFCHLIERGLRARGYPVEVVNGGVSGYSPTLEYVLLRDELLALEPDVVVLWYDLGDLQEDSWFQKNLIYDEAGNIVRADPRYRDGRFDYWEWAKNHSALAKYLDVKGLRTVDRIRVLGLGGYLGVILRGERAKVAIARKKAAERSADLAAHDRFLLIRPSSTKELIEPYWQLSAGYLQRIHELLAQRGIPFVLGVYPYGVVAGPEQWKEGRVFWGFERGKTYEANAALALFEAFSRERHLPLVNTFESFRRAAASQKLFYDQDGHLTPAGQRVLAEHVVADPAVLEIVARTLQRPHSKDVNGS